MRKLLIILLLAGCGTSYEFQSFYYTGDTYISDAVVNKVPVKFHGGTTDERFLSLRDDTLGFHATAPIRHGTALVEGVRIQAYDSPNSTEIRQKVILLVPMDTIRFYPEVFSFLMIWEL